MSAPTTPQPEPEIAKPAGQSVIQTLINHPIGFWFIFWGELAERCSFYGMMAILPRFIADANGLDLGDANSNTWISFFKTGAYLLPLAGGFLADQYFGKYRLIVLFSIPYILGHFLMSIETEWWTMVALSLLAMGSGIIKPNISTLMGMTYDQKRPGDEPLRSMAFGMFYMAINVGAAMSYLFLPMIRDFYGYSIAFMCPAVLMAVSFLIFAAGKPFYAVETINPRASTPEEKALKWLTLRRIAGIFLVITFFWAIFDQSHTIWVFFTRDFTDLHLFNHEISVEQIGFLNPLLIVIFVPLMPFLWNIVEKQGYRVRPTDKIVLGFVLTALSMLIMAIAGFQCDNYEDKQTEKKTIKRVVTPRFEMEIKAIFKSSCVECHGATATAGLDLRTMESTKKGGNSGSVLNAVDPSKSLIFKDHKTLIPGKATEEEKNALIKKWAGDNVNSKQAGALGGSLEKGLNADQKDTLTRWIETGATSVTKRNVSLWWIVLAFIPLTLAEVLISITGLELAFVVAPASMKSFVTALWLMTVAMANFFINAPVGRLYSNPFPFTTHTMSPGEYHLMLTGLMVLVIVVFSFVAQRFNQMAKEQDAAQKAALAPPPPPSEG